MYNVVDLFCGCGGSELGITRVKSFNTIFALDFWDKAVETYKHNFRNVNTVCEDIRNITKEKLLEYTKNEKIDVVIGGPPCQGFSLITRNKCNNENFKIEADKKNHLFLEFLRIVDILQPKVVVMENVKGILSMKNLKGDLILDNILKAYEGIGYHVKYKLVNISKLGLPQKRQRVIFIASKDKDLVDKFIYPDEILNIKYNLEDAIKDLPKNGNKYKIDYNKCSTYIKSLRNENIKQFNNTYHNPTENVLNRMKLIPLGGCIKDIHTNHPLKTKARFSNSYYKCNPCDLMPTISNPYKNMFINPYYNRPFNIREIARIQNFNDDYEFLINQMSTSNIGQMLANAIPPILTEKIFQELEKLLSCDN